MSASDPKRTFGPEDCCRAKWRSAPISLVANPCCNRVPVGVVLALGKAMRRRDFIKAVVGAVTAWPLAARAQQLPMPVVAFLKSTTPDDSAHLVRAFRQGLSEVGFAEGRNVTIEYRWAENQLDRLPELVA